MILENGLSYNFTVDRTEEANGSYFYVINVENKECWVKLYQFEIEQNKIKKIIRCEYKGEDSYGSHIFVRDRFSILQGLYSESKIYKFTYVKDGLDTNDKAYSLLQDVYGLTHRLYEELHPCQKTKSSTISCLITAIDKKRKILILHETDSNINKDTIWINEKQLFKAIDKEHLLNDYFYNIIQNNDTQSTSLFKTLYNQKKKDWIVAYLHYLDKKHKTIIIEQGDLCKIAEFAELIRYLIIWAKSAKICKLKRLPKLSKYEGLGKASKILENNTLTDYHNQIILSENQFSEMTTLFSLLEIDKKLFKSNLSFYISISEILSDITKEKTKCKNALHGILTSRISTEFAHIFAQNTLNSDYIPITLDAKDSAKELATLRDLFCHPELIDEQMITQYLKDGSTLTRAFSCIIYGCKFLHDIENSNKLLVTTNNIINLTTHITQSETSYENTEHTVHDISNQLQNKEEYSYENEETIKRSCVTTDSSHLIPKDSITDINNTQFYWILYNDGTYEITENPNERNSINRVIPIGVSPNKFMLLCYEHGSVNKISIRTLIEKKKNYRYLNGKHQQNKLKEVFLIDSDTYIVIVSTYSNTKYIKLYSTQNITTHSSLGLKGNQVVATNVDNAEYFLYPVNFIDQSSQRIIYNSATPLGKDINSQYYKKDIQLLREMGMLI